MVTMQASTARRIAATTLALLITGLGIDMPPAQALPTNTGWKSVVDANAYDYTNHHACGIDANDDLYCWGSGVDGVLGQGTSVTSSTVALPVNQGALAGKKIAKVVTSRYADCALTLDHLVACWGTNFSGQFGSGDPDYTSVRLPTFLKTSGALAGKTVIDLAMGDIGLCVLADDKKVYCTGDYRTLGRDNSLADTNEVLPIDTTGVLAGKIIDSLWANSGYDFCVTTTEGHAYCWGFNNFGQLGIGTTTAFELLPQAVPDPEPGRTWIQLSPGYYGTCGISSNFKALCWGWNSYGFLGDGTTTNRTTPTFVSTAGVLSGLSVTTLVTDGFYHTCALADGLPYCWGSAGGGTALGTGILQFGSNVPVAVVSDGALSGKSLLQLSLGVESACVRDSNGQGYCWGQNPEGVFGNATTTDSNVPVRAAATGPGQPSNVLAVPKNAAVQLSWTAAAVGGGLPIASYAITSSPSTSTPCSVTGTTATCAGLTNTVTYQFFVAAVTAVGTSTAIGSNLATPTGPPSAVRSLAWSNPRARRVYVAWRGPANNGGSAVTKYQFRYRAAGRTYSRWYSNALNRSHLFTGFTVGRRYYVQVRAVSSLGASPAATVSFKPKR